MKGNKRTRKIYMIAQPTKQQNGSAGLSVGGSTTLVRVLGLKKTLITVSLHSKELLHNVET